LNLRNKHKELLLTISRKFFLFQRRGPPAIGRSPPVPLGGGFTIGGGPNALGGGPVIGIGGGGV